MRIGERHGTDNSPVNLTLLGPFYVAANVLQWKRRLLHIHERASEEEKAVLERPFVEHANGTWNDGVGAVTAQRRLAAGTKGTNMTVARGGRVTAPAAKKTEKKQTCAP